MPVACSCSLIPAGIEESVGVISISTRSAADASDAVSSTLIELNAMRNRIRVFIGNLDLEFLMRDGVVVFLSWIGLYILVFIIFTGWC